MIIQEETQKRLCCAGLSVRVGVCSEGLVMMNVPWTSEEDSRGSHGGLRGGFMATEPGGSVGARTQKKGEILKLLL